MSAAYGHDISPVDDYYVSLAEEGVEKLTGSVFLGAVILNALPILRHLPSWLPGAGFKRFGEETRLLTDQIQNVPLELVRKNMVNLSQVFFAW